jgi:hypothetical protein
MRSPGMAKPIRAARSRLTVIPTTRPRPSTIGPPELPGFSSPSRCLPTEARALYLAPSGVDTDKGGGGLCPLERGL